MSTPSFFDVQLKDIINIMILIATLAAIYYGPIAATRLSIKMQDDKSKLDRRHSIFAALMKTRDMNLNFDHVAALNLIQLEFRDEEKVLNAHKSYMNTLTSPFPDASNQDLFDNFHKNKRNQLYDLIHSIGLVLGYNFDKRDLEDYSYAPIGWSNDEREARIFRSMVIELLSGRRNLHVAGPAIPNIDRFPPPPL